MDMEFPMDFDIKFPEAVENVVTTDANKPNTISSENQWDLPLERNDFSSDKEHKKFLNTVTRTVRSSVEYREWVDYLRNELQIKNCVISDESCEEVTIEIHHHPICLYDIVKAVTEKKVEENQAFTSCDIVKEVLQLHFNNNVGYTALATTLHEKYHNGHLDIPITSCHGNYSYILNNYNLDDDTIKRVSNLVKIKKTNQKWNNTL